MNDEALDHAKRNLRANFEYVSVIERFDESLPIYEARGLYRVRHAAPRSRGPTVNGNYGL